MATVASEEPLCPCSGGFPAPCSVRGQHGSNPEPLLNPPVPESALAGHVTRGPRTCLAGAAAGGVGRGGAVSALWLLLAIFPCRDLWPRACSWFWDPREGRDTEWRLSTDRDGLTQDAQLPGRYLPGGSHCTQICSMCERWIVGRTEFLRSVRSSRKLKMGMGS